MKIDLRPYQAAAFDQAREAVRNGARRILICAPTGGGKTVIASALMEMVKEKGKRAAFVVDRLSLIDQTSETFDRYGLDHGVIQGGHFRFRPSMPLQLCSVQTLGRRRWPETHVDVFDEAHVLHATHKKRLEEKASIVIGLTATPFTKGLGKWFDVVINVTTTRQLIDAGWLAPYRVFSCAEPDMSGVTVKSTGEWDETEASGKALEVVGDVVAEYLKHGDGRKFICSAVDTAHVAELARQFLAAGINVATYTYKDNEDDRAETTREFRKPDSAIRGLITVTAASRGFDVPDVSCVIMARPLRKSLAEHIQLFGRGLRIADGKKDCVARGTLVLTDRGEIPIEHVTLDHKVWDGQQFVSHAGAVCRGVREVIEYDGLIATPDHKVMTDDGWTRFEEAARWQRRIARTGVGGRPIRFIDDLRTDGYGKRAQPARRGGVRAMLWSALRFVSQHSQATRNGGMPALQWSAPGAGSGVAVSALPSADGSLLQSELGIIRAIRSAWNRVQVCVGERGGALGGRESWSSGSGTSVGSHPQHGALRTRQPSLGHPRWESEQHASVWRSSEVHRFPQGISGRQVRGRDACPALADAQSSGNRGALEGSLQQAQREVWDVLNAGPLQRFTANGRLVHNCLVLDHSGNMARFWQDCESFFDSGVQELDDGKKKEKPKPKEKAEAEPVKCGNCGHLHRPMPFCPNCGHEYPKKAAVQHVPGTLKELIAGGYRKELTSQLWPQVVGYVLERREGEAAKKQALAIYRGMTGEFPKGAWFESTVPVEPSAEVRSRIRAEQIRFAKGREKAARQETAEA